MRPVNTLRCQVFVLSEHVIKIIATIFKGFKILKFFQETSIEILNFCLVLSSRNNVGIRIRTVMFNRKSHSFTV
jgi:hypothetical protein